MKLLSAATPKGSRLAAGVAGDILVFSHAAGVPGAEALPLTLQAALAAPGGIEVLLPRLRAVIDHPLSRKYLVSGEEIQILRPYLPGNVFCAGLNYKAHAEEAKLALPKEPLLFAKWTNAMIGPGEAIILPAGSKEIDYEAELAVVIGRKCRGAAARDALDFVAGYMCVNDVSARDFQRADRQWSRSKSLDTFGPMGPWLVTADEIPEPQALGIRASLNGRTMQDSTTGDMIFGVRELIAYASRGMTLQPGDMICTGTPNGVGFARTPPVFLQPGDEIAIEIDSIGRLSNPVSAG